MTMFLTQVFGASWKTSLMGFVGAFVYYFSTAGIVLPTTMEEWKQALIGAGIYAWGRMQKDANVSNAPNPATAAPVS